MSQRCFLGVVTFLTHLINFVIMAKILFTAVVADMRNKIAGTVFSRNRAGAFARTKVTPVNPQTTYQTGSRSRFTGWSQGWRGLTDAQRSSWNDATTSYPKTDQFGNIYYLTGAQLYQSLNNTLQVVSGTALTEPPVPDSVEAITSASFTMANGTPAASLTFAPTPVPANTAYMIYATPGVSPGVNFVKNQFRLITVAAAAASSPLDFLTAYTTKFGSVPAAGQKVFLKIVPVNTVTGQQGQGFQVSATVSA